jgi:hypothetical protein
MKYQITAELFDPQDKEKFYCILNWGHDFIPLHIQSDFGSEINNEMIRFITDDEKIVDGKLFLKWSFNDLNKFLKYKMDMNVGLRKFERKYLEKSKQIICIEIPVIKELTEDC